MPLSTFPAQNAVIKTHIFFFVKEKKDDWPLIIISLNMASRRVVQCCTVPRAANGTLAGSRNLGLATGWLFVMPIGGIMPWEPLQLSDITNSKKTRLENTGMIQFRVSSHSITPQI